MAWHNGFEIIGQVKIGDQIVTRTMSVYTKETYAQVWARAHRILVDDEDKDEHLMNFTVKPIKGNSSLIVSDDVGEILVPQSDKPEPMGIVVQHPRNGNRYEDTLRTAAEIAVSRLQEARGSALPIPYVMQTPAPVVTNVHIKVPEGVIEVNVDTPTVTTLNASDKEEEVCFS